MVIVKIALANLSLGMAVFFQKISEETFDLESDFIVRESKKMHFFVGILFLILSIAAFQMSIIIGSFILIFAILAFARGFKRQIIIRINKEGIFYYGKLLTDWPHFISYQFIDEAPMISANSAGLGDRFFLMIKYDKKDLPGHFGRKIRLTNTQDKAEEEIIAAINFYCNNWRDRIHAF